MLVNNLLFGFEAIHKMKNWCFVFVNLYFIIIYFHVKVHSRSHLKFSMPEWYFSKTTAAYIARIPAAVTIFFDR